MGIINLRHDVTLLHLSKQLTKLLISGLFKKKVGLAESPISGVSAFDSLLRHHNYKDLANFLSPFLLRATNFVQNAHRFHFVFKQEGSETYE
jgi:hypothetical protein